MVSDYISRQPHICATYMLSNPSRSLYIGVTTDLERRIYEHKTRFFDDGHTARYGIDRLVWWEQHQNWHHAHSREDEIKGWLREKKVALIQVENPRWLDLSYGLFHWSSSRFR